MASPSCLETLDPDCGWVAEQNRENDGMQKNPSGKGDSEKR
ncbi:MAG TPA: hypothetical protein VJ695_03505 [Nitrososphaera sp.]|nr:hypothetical protein [Nitrososphaera sp.]